MAAPANQNPPRALRGTSPDLPVPTLARDFSVPSPLPIPTGLAAADRDILAALLFDLHRGARIDATQVDAAEALDLRHSGMPAVRATLLALLEAAAAQAAQAGRAQDTIVFRRRLVELRPSARDHAALVQAYIETRDWSAAEAACRAALSSSPGDTEAYGLLGFVLMQQDRNEEAADALRRSLASRENSQVRSLLVRVESGLKHEQGMAQREGQHFHLRFEGGDAQAELGQAIVSHLERKYTELSQTLDCEPDREIPVILYSRQKFVATSRAIGASSWAIGTFSDFDGRIRVAIGDLGRDLPSDLEETLTHELVHAFVAAKTRGNAPRDLNEGLAQHLAGEYSKGVTREEGQTFLKRGRIEVGLFYRAAKSFVIFLIDRYRQTAFNEMLAALGKTGNVDEAFRAAYRETYAEAQEEWVKQLP